MATLSASYYLGNQNCHVDKLPAHVLLDLFHQLKTMLACHIIKTDITITIPFYTAKLQC